MQTTDSGGSIKKDELEKKKKKRMNWKNDRIKCGPDVSGLDNKINDGALYLERVWVWRNLT